MKPFASIALVLTGLAHCTLAFAQGAAPAPPAAPKVNVDLVVSIGGKTVLGEADFNKMSFANESAKKATLTQHTIAIRRGQSVQLRVVQVTKSGIRKDITSSTSYIKYDSTSGLTVSKTGLVTAKPRYPPSSPEFLWWGLGLQTVMIATYGGGSSGWNTVLFKVKP